MEVFSTITSPVFSELVLIIGEDDITDLPSDMALLETLRMMNEVRPFRLVFLFPVLDEFWRGFQWERRRELEEALDSVIAGGSFDFLNSPPSISEHDLSALW